MHVLLCIVTGRYSSQLYIAYAPLVSTQAYDLSLNLVPPPPPQKKTMEKGGGASVHTWSN
jgi:hypothetical protein